MDDWLNGYEHDPERGAGLSIGWGRPKVVLHTTESPRGSYAGIRNMWRGSANWGKGLPHFLSDGARYVQLLPLSVNAHTLENRAGGVDTNRAGHVIQVERCGYAREGMNDGEYNALGRWLADLNRAGLGIDLSQHPRFYGEGEGIILAAYNSPIRMQGEAWVNFNGFCGHQHVPENAHWDPGRIDGNRIEQIARGISGEPYEPPDLHYPPPPNPGTVRLGSTGDAVRQVQQRLQDRGWVLSVDSQFGPITDGIVRQYQQEKGLVVDGVVGRLTWISMWALPIT